MLRSSLLYLSEADWARNAVMRTGPVRRSAQRFVAGDTLEQAMNVVRRLNQRGLDVTLDHLGESVTDRAGAAAATDAYLALLEAIAISGVRATASLKLTQLGLDIAEDLCIENLRRILETAQATDNHVTVDMESTAHTDATLRIYRLLRDAHGFANVGTVIQSYLYRSEGDMDALAAEGAFVRLCKGAYKEPPDRAFPDKADVDANYIHLTRRFLTADACAAGAYLGLATHDERMIEAALKHIKRHDIPLDCFEFQMLYGIRGRLQQQLVDEGYRVRVYVGYGTEWYPFFMRRLAERPANLWFILSNFLRR